MLQFSAVGALRLSKPAVNPAAISFMIAYLAPYIVFADDFNRISFALIYPFNRILFTGAGT